MDTFSNLPTGDYPHDECGVIGVCMPNEEAARTIYFGLHALQHRGQEAAGIAVSEVSLFLKQNRFPERVIFVCFSSSDLAVYGQALVDLCAKMDSVSGIDEG